MRVTRLYLQNYRVYEQPLELELPPGLVGIYGPNGAGKSVLLESIRFTLFGRSRTANDEVRTAGVNAECITEVEFEHEGHLYVVRRTIAGVNSTMKAQAVADGLQVAEGVRDTSRYVQSILGMDDTAFRASVFAEQKQLAAFSQQAPAERRRLVLQLLGITPLDSARDMARKDARLAKDQFEKMRAMLPDLEQLQAELKAAQQAAGEAESSAAACDKEQATVQEQLAASEADYRRLDVVRQEHDLLVAEGRALRAEHDRTVALVENMTKEVHDLDLAAENLARLRPLAEGWRVREARLRLVEAVVAARHAVDAAAVPPPPERPDEAACEQARVDAEERRRELAEVKGRLETATAERDRARQAVERSQRLTGEEDCPLCGQSLGTAFSQVQEHRASELAEAEARLNELELERRRLSVAAREAAEMADNALRTLKGTREAWAVHEKAAERRAHAEEALAAAMAQLAEPMRDGELSELSAEVERGRQAFDECQRLQGRLERREKLVAEVDVERARAAESEGRLDSLRQKVQALGFEPEALAEAASGVEAWRTKAAACAGAAQSARVALAQARTAVDAGARRVTDAEHQHAQLAQVGEDARHLDRLALLLNTFRNTLVATVGPRLSAQAAELFAELTDHEYDLLEVDPDSYEIKVRDAGTSYGMARFSGSETDLANLALRVAVSEQVRFQSGGAVGLLVLDEVFGPLDEDRKERMLLALERLRSRFRQVLVVTHDPSIKEQLPNAIEVVKLPGRRATARVINA